MYPGRLTQTTSNTASKTSIVRRGRAGCEECKGGGFAILDCSRRRTVFEEPPAIIGISRGNGTVRPTFRKEVGLVKKGIIEGLSRRDTIVVTLTVGGIDRIEEFSLPFHGL